MVSGKNLLETSLTEHKIQCLINSPSNNKLFRPEMASKTGDKLWETITRTGPKTIAFNHN